MNELSILVSIVRPEEKLLFECLRKNDVNFTRIDPRSALLDLDDQRPLKGILLDRSISRSQAYPLLFWYEQHGATSVNTCETTQICSDKALCSIRLAQEGIPIPRNIIAHSVSGALEAIEQIGYPAVLKPPVGSWGRLLSKVNDRDAAEAILEHKEVLGGFQHGVFYVQEFVKTGGFDIRAFVVGGRCICAIARNSDHWITNTARGGKASNYPVTKDLAAVAEAAARAIYGDIVAIDIFETSAGYIVNEVNPSMEFRNSITTTGVDIPQEIVNFLMERLRDDSGINSRSVGIHGRGSVEDAPLASGI